MKRAENMSLDVMVTELLCKMQMRLSPFGYNMNETSKLYDH